MIAGGSAAGGVELGYAEITSAFATTSTTAVDVPGLSITFLARSRPIILRGWAITFRHTVASTVVTAQIVDAGNSVQVQAVPMTPAVANGGSPPILMECRLALIQGTSYTFKVQVFGGAAGTSTMGAGAANRAFLQAIEV